MGCLVLHCRSGFESECADEVVKRVRGIAGSCKAKAGSGYVVYPVQGPDDAVRLAGEMDVRSLVFARQMFASPGLLAGMPVDDRITPLLAALDPTWRFCDVHLETPDTDEAKELLAFCRKLSRPLGRTLTGSGRLVSSGGLRLHVLFLSATAAYPGVSRVEKSSPWLMGIPRLRLPRGAPSRSALKLEEARHVFLPGKQGEMLMRSGMQAVDLGAAPGGWSFVLARRGLRVIAVDNGKLDRRALETGLVEHLRADGFTYRPKTPVDWMVCDMVEQPGRVARLVARWLAEGHCRRSIFNLKLPMKKRALELARCREILNREMKRKGTGFEIEFKHLYHDRDEVTGYVHRH
jgi:23S rRNA (cytidine2498-2'-O)-methyltransferase